MSRVRIYAAASADGFIADINGSTDWLSGFDPAAHGYEEFYAGVGAIVVGRRTFDFQRTFGEWAFEDRKAFVVTSRALADAPANVTTVRSGGVTHAIEAARGLGKGDVWIVGGAVVMRTALEAGLVDLIEIFSVPIMLGGGLPLLGALDEPLKLTLQGLETYQDGVVKLAYAPHR